MTIDIVPAALIQEPPKGSLLKTTQIHYEACKTFFLPFHLQEIEESGKVIEAVIWLAHEHAELGLNSDSLFLATSWHLYMHIFNRKVSLNFCLGKIYANFFKPRREEKDFCYQMTRFCLNMAQSYPELTWPTDKLDSNYLREMLSFYASLFQYVRGTHVVS